MIPARSLPFREAARLKKLTRTLATQPEQQTP
jgi:hypothetical protein